MSSWNTLPEGFLDNSFLGGTGYEIPTDLTIDGNLTVEKNVVIDGNLTVNGSYPAPTGGNLLDSSTFIVNAVDQTKRLGFSLAGATAGTTVTLQGSQTSNNVLTLPNAASDTLCALNFAQSLQNKSLLNSTCKFADATDSTKQVKFDTSASAANTALTLAATATTNRTITFPDITDTVVTLNASQTLSCK